MILFDNILVRIIEVLVDKLNMNNFCNILCQVFDLKTKSGKFLTGKKSQHNKYY